jgi:hypothetical protein
VRQAAPVGIPNDLGALLVRLRELLPEFRERYHVLSLAVFGSRVRDDFSPQSDLDLLVSFGPEASLLDLVAMEQDLGDRLGVKVDVVTRNSIKARLKDRILGSAVPV